MRRARPKVPEPAKQTMSPNARRNLRCRERYRRPSMEPHLDLELLDMLLDERAETGLSLVLPLDAAINRECPLDFP